MRRFSLPAFEIKGNKAVCKMGLMPAEIAEIRMEYEYRPELAHNEKRLKCWKQAGLPEDGATLSRKVESGYESCMSN